MGASTGREEVLQSEQDVLNLMNPPVKFESYDVMCAAPSDRSNSSGSETFPIRTLRIRARDNCASGVPPEDAELGDPLVLLHGYACGLAIFYKLLPILVDRFQKNTTGVKRDIYAFDFLGQGASGRPSFDLDKTDVDETERYLSACIDGWVCAQFPDMAQRIHLCGHSFGGCCSALYSLHYPHRIASLGLMSPLLGFQPRERNDEKTVQSLLRWIAATAWEHQITPHRIMYSLGSVGTWLAKRSNKWRFQSLAMGVSEQEGEKLSKYLAEMFRLEPSNSRALLTLFEPGLLVKRPILERLLNNSVCRSRMHVCYGDFDWMRGDRVFETLPADVPSSIFANSQHHVYLDNPTALADHLAKNVRVLR